MSEIWGGLIFGRANFFFFFWGGGGYYRNFTVLKIRSGCLDVPSPFILWMDSRILRKPNGNISAFFFLL